MLQRRDPVPHFVVTTIDGREVRYADIWHQRFLVLVCAGTGDPADHAIHAYAAELVDACLATDVETTCVVTTKSIDGVPRPGALVADRYGEIAFVTGLAAGEALPSPAELAEWVRYIGIKCS